MIPTSITAQYLNRADTPLDRMHELYHLLGNIATAARLIVDLGQPFHAVTGDDYEQLDTQMLDMVEALRALGVELAYLSQPAHRVGTGELPPLPPVAA